jgi:DNA-binding CsgD family transcriptional regulator
LKLSVNDKWLFLIVLIGIQALCALFFIYDIAQDFIEGHTGTVFYLAMELLASLSLVAAATLEYGLLRGLSVRHTTAERSLKVAQGKMQDVIDAYFIEWGLTAAEADVATLAIKGISIAEIANYRHAQEGTIKTQLTSIYRKAGVTGRNQLGSLLIEDLMGPPVS